MKQVLKNIVYKMENVMITVHVHCTRQDILWLTAVKYKWPIFMLYNCPFLM